MGRAPQSRNYWLYLQYTGREVSSESVFAILAQFGVKSPKNGFERAFFWLCLDLPKNVAAGKLVDAIKQELGITADEYLQTLSDFEGVEEDMARLAAETGPGK